MRFSFTAFLLLLALSLSAQNDLPKGLSPQEFSFLESGLYSFPEDVEGIPAPPPYPVRSMAEWEELQALVITWTSFKPILAQIVEHAKEECEVIVVCSDSLSAKFELTNNYGLPDLDNVSFLQAPYNTIWIRDYGPNCVYANGVDSLYLIDWIYNRPRPKDDLIPDKVGEFMNIPVYSTTAAPTDFVHTGGNYLSDGMGTAFSSELILEENEPGNPYGVTPKDEAAIDQIMETFMGVDRYIKMPILPYDGIHHIDMHWFLLDEETFIVGEYPEGVSDGPQIEANLQYVLANYMSPYGTPYKVIRIQMPPGNTGAYPWTGGPYRTYTNALFVNKTLLVPTYSPQYDEANLQIYRDALPGYKVVGINCNSIIGSLGALHCITKPVGVDDPLLIQHQPLEDVNDYAGDFEVEATIRHRSGISEAMLYYTTDTAQGYAAAAMTLTNPAEHTWTGYIPSQSTEAEVFYYIEGQSNSGKTLVRPLSAPAGFWNFDVSFTSTATAEVDPKYHTGLDPIFPNPASAITCIPVQSSRSMEARIELIDMLGRTVHTVFAGDLPEGESRYFIHANGFDAGTYIVRLQTEHQQQLQKLIIR
jgi:agmatine/peptidylarginine deiminase